ncbi:MAG TPA: Sua5/YciO/YrdC/YwlC family protein [Pseudomonadales bacterium]|nr:Sua5/YciO/YrdC/YwlC family protein [Pseudomonadales bacterium]
MPLVDKKIAANTAFHIPLAVNALHAGGIIAYPTEAVWGIGCDPFCEEAVEELLDIKRRNWRKGVILVAADMAQLEPYLYGLDDTHLQTLIASWPGPNTWLIPNNGAAPDWISGGRDTLAVRVSAHPVVNALCKKFGGALVSTSANPAGKPPARSLFDVRRYFGKQLDAVVPGALGGLQNPTQIRDVITGEICRQS